MAFSDFIRALRKPTGANEYVASRPAAGSLSATGSLALNDDDGLAAKVINTPAHTGNSERLAEQVEDQPEDTQPTDTEDQAEDVEDQAEDEQPLSVRDLLLREFAGESDLPPNITQEDVDWARRIVVQGDQAMDVPMNDRTVRRDARTQPTDTFNLPTPAPTAGQQAAINYLRETGEIGTVAVPDKGLSELLEAATSQNDEVVDMVLDAIETGGATGTFFDQ